MKPLDYWSEKAAQQQPTSSGEWSSVFEFFGRIVDLIVTFILL